MELSVGSVETWNRKNIERTKKNQVRLLVIIGGGIYGCKYVRLYDISFKKCKVVCEMQNNQES